MKRLLFLALPFLLAAASLPGRADLSPRALQKAAAGDPIALHKVFKQSLQESGGTTSMSYARELRQILESVGNARFTAALRSEPPVVQRRVVLYLNIAMNSH